MSDRIGAFIEGFNLNQSIEDIHISSGLGSKNFRRLSHFFWRNYNLRELSFRSMNNIGIDSARSIGYMLSQCGQSSLRKISFEDSDASDVVLAEITKAISNHSQLEELDLSGNNLGREGCVALGSALEASRNPKLQGLNLCNNIIDDEGLRALVAGMKNCRNLTNLSLTGNVLITVDGCKSLSTLFRSRCRLTHLNLDQMNIGGDGARVIAAGLAKLRLLEELDLSHNSIGNEGASTLAGELGLLYSLKRLIVSNNSIGNDGAGALAHGLTFVHSLKELDLSSNSIGDAGVTALSYGLAYLHPLERVNLSNNSFGDEGLRKLAENLSKCNNVSWLDLSGTRLITASGLRNLSTLLQSRKCSLTYLLLCGMNFGDEMATALAVVVEGNKSLKNLHFNPAGLTSVGWSAFSKLLCNTSSVNNTYLSNHTLQIIGNSYRNLGAPDDVKHFLALNKYVADDEVAIQKIVESHPDFDVNSMFQWKLKLLPHVMSTLGRVHTRKLVYSEGNDMLIGADPRDELQNMKLSTIYKFTRGMPLLIVDCYRSDNEEDSDEDDGSPRKRKIDQLYH
jgi:Ran GTPase-activating protein (RanGAP) involved in mRNA processing and transport